MATTQNEFNELLPGEGTARRIFDKYANKDDRVLYAELKKSIESPEYEHDLPDNVVEKVTSTAEKDNSASIAYKDFVLMMTQEGYNDGNKQTVRTDSVESGHVATWAQRALMMYVTAIVPERMPASGVYNVKHEIYGCKPPAICMIIISVVELALFCYDATFEDEKGNLVPLFERPVTKALLYRPSQRRQVWRYATYMLVHTNALHLLQNLVIQLILGVPLDMVHRWWRVSLVYLAGGTAGALASTFVAVPGDVVVGASAGVYALSTAHIATVIMNWSKVKTAIIQVIGFVIILSKDVAVALFFPEKNDIALHVVHYTGAVAGLLVGIGIFQNLDERRWERRLWWVAVVVYCCLVIVGVVENVFWLWHISLPNAENPTGD